MAVPHTAAWIWRAAFAIRGVNGLGGLLRGWCTRGGGGLRRGGRSVGRVFGVGAVLSFELDGGVAWTIGQDAFELGDGAIVNFVYFVL